VAYPPEAVDERSRFDRIWPSLVALAGTIAVVMALLWAFGDNLDAEPEEGLAAEDSELTDDVGDSDEDTNDDESEADADQDEPPGDPVIAPPELRETVGILNATSVSGLATRAKERFEAGGWSVPAVGDYSQQVEASTIYYPPGMEDSAEALRAQFPEIRRIEQTIPGLAQDRLVVILAQDYADAVGDTG
jgi:hypothetical protein